ncbi:MAG: hypothetical protein SPH93_05725 [Clostridium sp.]|uniref:hypothetical protein n=1 Tax=Clostridium sp. TaxID=1506 RepID=UPI002A909A73|nr:hypothetical protein [Clostridium sp.]MDY6227157.1 hypothetical protein [Clostridium sp.]
MIKKILFLTLSLIIFLGISFKNVSAAEITNLSTYEFSETPNEIIDMMKNSLGTDESFNKSVNSDSIVIEDRSISSMMADALKVAGFEHSSSLLVHSIIPMREEPKIISSDSSLSNDIWTYSPDFRNVVTNFLYEARNNTKYEYFRTTTMKFNMPENGKWNFIKEADLFGALHEVKINLGVVKHGIQWDVLVMIQDRYDFADAQYDSLVGVVNNLAKFEQDRNRIVPYDLFITANKGNLITLPFNVPLW